MAHRGGVGRVVVQSRKTGSWAVSPEARFLNKLYTRTIKVHSLINTRTVKRQKGINSISKRSMIAFVIFLQVTLSKRWPDQPRFQGLSSNRPHLRGRLDERPWQPGRGLTFSSLRPLLF